MMGLSVQGEISGKANTLAENIIKCKFHETISAIPRTKDLIQFIQQWIRAN